MQQFLMCRSSSTRVRFAAGLSLLGAFAGFGNGASRGVAYAALPVAQAASAVADTDSLLFTRPLKSDDGNISALQTAVRRLDPKNSSDPTVYLVAVTHIGEKAYYQQLQQLLDKQDLVLFEGVKASAETRAKPLAEQKEASKKAHTLQKRLSDLLGVEFQLEGIDYKRPTFHNSDLSWDDLVKDAKESGPGTEQELSKLQATMNGGGIGAGDDGEKIDKMMTLAESNPLAAQFFRKILLTALADPSALAEMKKQATTLAPETATKPESHLNDVLIQKRNVAVLQDFQKDKSALPPHASVALFYGAGHMSDLETHLVKDMGYHVADVQWLTAMYMTPPAVVTATAPAVVPADAK